MAPALDDFSLSAPNNYKIATEWTDRLAVLSSEEDEVLRFIYPLGDLLQSFIYFWKETAGMALGYRGPISFESWDRGQSYPIPKNVCSKPIPKEYGIDHGDYLPSIPIKNEQRSATAFADSFINGKMNPPCKRIA